MVKEQREFEEPDQSPTNEVLASVPGNFAKQSALSLDETQNISSCVSAPPSTFSAMAMLAEEKMINEEDGEGQSAIPTAVMTPFSENMRQNHHGDHSWLRKRRTSRPSLSTVGVDKPLPGDLASPKVESGMPPGQGLIFRFLDSRSKEKVQHIPRPSVRQNALAEKWEPSQDVDDFHTSDDDDDNLEILSVSSFSTNILTLLTSITCWKFLYMKYRGQKVDLNGCQMKMKSLWHLRRYLCGKGRAYMSGQQLPLYNLF